MQRPGGGSAPPSGQNHKRVGGWEGPLDQSSGNVSKPGQKEAWKAN